MSKIEQSVESALLLDSEYSERYDALMARFRKLAASFSKQVEEDSRVLNTWNKERESLRRAAMRFGELEELSRPRQERLEISVALMMNRPVRLKANKDGSLLTDEDDFDGTRIPVEIDRLDVALYPLWKIIREIVRHTSEIRIVKLENILKDFGLKTRRQSIESALKTHKKDFRIAKRGREKFIALK